MRGVRKISSKRSGSLDTLNHVFLGLSKNNTGFYSINEVKIINSFAKLKESLDLIFAGMYFAELIDIFLDQEHESLEIFNLLKAGLNVLSKNPSKPERIVNVFESRLMDRMGFGLTLDENKGDVSKMLDDITHQKDLSVVMQYDDKVANRASSLIKDHLKRMVETYARYPRLNRFLNEYV